jgi:hypothetical protein
MNTEQKFDLEMAFLGGAFNFVGVLVAALFTYWLWKRQHKIELEKVDDQRKFDLAWAAAERAQSRLVEAVGLIFEFKRSMIPDVLERALLAASAARAEKVHLEYYPGLPEQVYKASQIMRKFVRMNKRAQALAEEAGNGLATPVTLLFADRVINNLSEISRMIVAARIDEDRDFPSPSEAREPIRWRQEFFSHFSSKEKDWILWIEEQFKADVIDRAEAFRDNRTDQTSNAVARWFLILKRHVFGGARQDLDGPGVVA